MELPFAVYTARHGYEWVSGAAHGRATLERMRRAVGKTPDFDYGASACCGAVNDGDTVAVYRFMRAEKWDSKGRNAAYLALSFFPRSVAGAIDFERLLGMEVFTKPLREPPEWLDYEGPGAAASGFDPEAEGRSGETLDLSGAGSVFQRPFAGELRVLLDDGAASCSVSYRRSHPLLIEGVQPPTVKVAVREGVEHTTSWQPEPKVCGPRLLVRVAWVAAASALFVGGVYWRSTRCGKRDAIIEPVCENAEHGEGCNDGLLWLFDADGHWQGLLGCPEPHDGKDGAL